MRLYSAIKPLQSGHNLHASRAGPERREEEKAEVQRAGKDFMEGKRSQQDSPTTPTGAPSPLDTLRHQTGQTRSPRACSVPPTRDLCRDISGANSLNEYARTHAHTHSRARAHTHPHTHTRTHTRPWGGRFRRNDLRLEQRRSAHDPCLPFSLCRHEGTPGASSPSPPAFD